MVTCAKCQAVIVSREPWWKAPPQGQEPVLQLEWGYVVRCERGHWDFDAERPSDDEILNRKSCFLYRSLG